MNNDYNEWWALGGVAIGIILSVAVFYASVEVAKWKIKTTTTLPD